MGGLELSLRLRRGSFTLEMEQTLPANGLTAIFGPSGAGKSSILRAIAGFERTGGRISLMGEVWEEGGFFRPPHQRRVGYVFQQPQLFAHLDVVGNLRYAARRGAGENALAELVRDFDLAPLLARRPAALSGGEAQRVALVRALLTSPRLLLMDEPLSALDAARRAEILPHIERLRDQVGLPILYVSHSMAEVARLATHVLALSNGKVAGFGRTADVLADAAAAPAFGGEEPGSLIEAISPGLAEATCGSISASIRAKSFLRTCR
ncbi:MAG: ATP-binding cassette domain-containing protein, partial [Rhodobacteraceae bacterium]|nr:ATP-binding cassette domain-containing protein [Paracoccaceae bacterium]